jgi:hypothetical protein
MTDIELGQLTIALQQTRAWRKLKARAAERNRSAETREKACS